MSEGDRLPAPAQHQFLPQLGPEAQAGLDPEPRRMARGCLLASAALVAARDALGLQAAQRVEVVGLGSDGNAAAVAWCLAAPQRCCRAWPGVPGSGTISAASFLQESAPARRERQEEGSQVLK